MRHPIEKYNEQQAAMLAELPENQREYMARMFRIGNAAYRYYQRVNELSIFSKGADGSTNETVETMDDLLAWLEEQLNPQVESRSARELLNVYFDRTAEAGVSGWLTARRLTANDAAGRAR